MHTVNSKSLDQSQIMGGQHEIVGDYFRIDQQSKKAGKSSIKSAGTNSSCCGLGNCLRKIAIFFGCMTDHASVKKQIKAIVDFRANHSDEGNNTTYTKLVGNLSNSTKNEIRELGLQLFAYRCSDLVSKEDKDDVKTIVKGFLTNRKFEYNKVQIDKWIKENKNEKATKDFLNELFTDSENPVGDAVFTLYLKDVKAKCEETKKVSVKAASENSQSLFARFIRFITCGVCYKTDREKTINLVQDIVKFRIEAQKITEQPKKEEATTQYKKLVDSLLPAAKADLQSINFESMALSEVVSEKVEEQETLYADFAAKKDNKISDLEKFETILAKHTDEVAKWIVANKDAHKDEAALIFADPLDESSNQIFEVYLKRLEA